jgi:hypothetical protein
VDVLITMLVWGLPLLPWIALYFIIRHGPFLNRFWKGENFLGFGLTVGGIAFLIGFVGPMIFGGGNQGPLLGIFYTGPIGTAVGLAWGLFRAARRRTKE